MGVEELVRTFDYAERPQVFEYYPQYYHKTDKVRLKSATNKYELVEATCQQIDR